MKKCLLSFILFCNVFNLVHAQTDFGLWGGIAIEKELSKKFEFQLEEEFRLDNNVTNLNRLLTEVGLQYKVNKYYRIALGYRFTYYTEGGFGNRLVLSNAVKYKVEDLTFNYRLNLQTDFHTERPIRYKIRNKIGIDYKINKRWEIGVAGELFYSFYYNRNVLDRYRLSFGADYKINKHHKIGPGLMYQSEFNVANPESDVVLRIGYKYSF